MRVLAIDPGKHVGLAYLDGDDFRCWEDTPAGYYGAADSWIAGVDRVVIESFSISGQRAREANETIEMIGVTRYLCALRGTKMFEQSPADAKAFGTTAKMKALGWWRTGSDHQQSAARHLMLHCAKHNLIDARSLVPRDSL